MYFVKTPYIIQHIFPQFTWRKLSKNKVLYLTFDDGPLPHITPWVLKTLKEYQAQATFFCLGQNAIKHPHILSKIQEEGHSIGNHTYSHHNGWTTKTQEYIQDVEKCAEYIPSSLFRPPYGRMTPKQAKILQSKYKIVLWDVMCGDFDTSISNETCWQNILNNTKNGSILVLHDNVKSEEKLRYVLPRILAHYSDLGYIFKRINPKVK